MNARLHERIPADIEVQVTNLNHRELSGPAWIVDASKGGMALIMRTKFAENDLVQVNYEDCQFFGHVIYVREDNQLFHTGLEVERVLLGRSDLGLLVEALAGESAPGVVVVAPAE